MDLIFKDHKPTAKFKRHYRGEEAAAVTIYFYLSFVITVSAGSGTDK
ncbi:MAG: hypothetical protein ACREEM_03615 [Blastocatellia bacterium]